jgi:hypothetical protein
MQHAAPQKQEIAMSISGRTGFRAGALALALVGVGAVVNAVTPAFFHNPLTVAAKLSQGFEIPGAGRFDINYAALHFNKENYDGAMKNQQAMDYFNANIWGKLGPAKLGFAVSSGDVKLAAGDYTFGINMGKDDAFSAVFWKGDEKKPTAIPLKVEKDQKPVNHLVVTLMATDVDNVYTLEARCGPYRGTCDLTVPQAPAKAPGAPAKKGG